MKILFFKSPSGSIIAVQTSQNQPQEAIGALEWLFSCATALEAETLPGLFVGPRREMITPWSTTAVEITQNMNIGHIRRIEEYFPVQSEDAAFDKMLQRLYHGLDQNIFTVDHTPDPIEYITDFEEYNRRFRQKR